MIGGVWLSALLAILFTALLELYAAWAIACGLWCAIREPRTFAEFAVRGVICVPLAVILVLGAVVVAERWPHLDYDVRRFIVVFVVSATLVGATWSAIRWPRTWKAAGGRAALILPMAVVVAAAVHVVVTRRDRDEAAACRRDAAGIELRSLSFSPSGSPTAATVSLVLPAGSRDLVVEVRGDEGIAANPVSQGTLGPLSSPAPNSLSVPLVTKADHQPTHWNLRIYSVAPKGRLVTVEYDTTSALEERQDKGLCWVTRAMPASVRLEGGVTSRP